MTLAAIVQKFQLDADSANSEAVLLALKKRLGELHPDRHGGNFTSDESRETFHEVQSTIDSFEVSSALVPLKEVTALVEVLAKSIAPLSGMQEENLRIQRIGQIKESVEAQHHGMKVTSGTFLAISSGLLAFMGSLKDNPILGRFLEIPAADLGLLAIWLYSGGFFVWSWVRERRAAAYAEFLSTDDGLAHTFKRLQREDLRTLQNGLPAFTRKHVVDTIYPRDRHRTSIFPFVALGIGGAAAEAIAPSQIEKLLFRGVVSRATSKSVQEWFQIDTTIDED